MELTLSPRLARIASYVEPGAVVIDVGTDHAYVPIWLLRTGCSAHAYASDNKPGPLRNAEADARRCGVCDQLTLYLCEGLALCAPEDVDTIILAGMGGETMIHILSDAPWAKEKRLVLQPQSKIPELRRWLAEHGLAVLDASLVDDTGRIYLVWRVGAGKADGGAAIDSPLLTHRDPLLRPWLEEQIKRGRKQARGLRAARQPDEQAIAALEAELDTLEEIRKETQKW